MALEKPAAALLRIQKIHLQPTSGRKKKWQAALGKPMRFTVVGYRNFELNMKQIKISLFFKY